MAVLGPGTKIFWSTTTAMSTAQAVTGVTGVTMPSAANAMVDVTDLDSTAKVFLASSVQDAGTIGLEINYVSTDTGQIALRTDGKTGTKRNIAIKLTDASSQLIHADAYVSEWSGPKIGMDDKLTVSATIRLTGGLTYTTN